MPSQVNVRIVATELTLQREITCFMSSGQNESITLTTKTFIIISLPGMQRGVHRRISNQSHTQGNSVIAVNGDEKVDLENTQLYQKASRSSLT